MATRASMLVVAPQPASTTEVTGRPSDEQLARSLRLVARTLGQLATYCDKAEHNELSDLSGLRNSASQLREIAEDLAGSAGVELRPCYSDRLFNLERNHVLAGPGAPAPWTEVDAAKTWRDLQLAQVNHDRFYHPDIFGMSKQDQLRHYTLHVAKIAGHLATVCSDVSRWRLFGQTRLVDLVLFGIKISTVTGEVLAEDPLPEVF
jgi:hypothetical protein